MRRIEEARKEAEEEEAREKEEAEAKDGIEEKAQEEAEEKAKNEAGEKAEAEAVAKKATADELGEEFEGQADKVIQINLWDMLVLQMLRRSSSDGSTNGHGADRKSKCQS